MHIVAAKHLQYVSSFAHSFMQMLRPTSWIIDAIIVDHRAIIVDHRAIIVDHHRAIIVDHHRAIIVYGSNPIPRQHRQNARFHSLFQQRPEFQ